MIKGFDDRARNSFYSVCFCGNDGEEKTEFHAVHETDMVQLLRICRSQGVPVLVDRPNFGKADENCEEVPGVEIGE